MSMEQTQSMLLKLSIFGWILASSSFLVWACQAVEVPNRGLWKGEVRFQASGGFAGIRRSLVILNDGSFVARDEKFKKETRGTFDSKTLNELITVFKLIDIKEETNKPSSLKRCADCLQYSLWANVDNRRHQVTLNSVSTDTSEYGQVVGFLSQILGESLSQSVYK